MPRVVLSALVTSLLIGACGGDDDDGESGVAGPSEVALEQTGTQTPNPFTPPAGEDNDDVRPPPEVADRGRTTFRANLPGLYGGTRDSKSCDRVQLVRFLEENPDKARAWADVVRIETRQIERYIDDLTPVLLRTDTRVTNHGFIDGRANPTQSLLQAGTAVLVDKYGQPVVKCYCGNPLLPPVALAAPRYTGPQWAHFQPGVITIIERTTTIIERFVLYDPATGKLFERPRGTDGRDDGPTRIGEPELEPLPDPQPPGTPPDVVTPEPEPEPAPQPPRTPPAATEQPSAYFNPRAGGPRDTYTLYAEGFAPNTSLKVTLTRPDGVSEDYNIRTGSTGSGSYTFAQTGDAIPATYTAVVTNPNTGARTSASTTVSG